MCCFIWLFKHTLLGYLINFSFFSFTSEGAGAGTAVGTGTVRMQKLLIPRCVQGPGGGELSADAEQQEDGSPAHSDPHRQQVRPGPPVCLLFRLPHRGRAPAPAPAERHRFFPQLHPEIGTTRGSGWGWGVTVTSFLSSRSSGSARLLAGKTTGVH